MKIKLPAFIHKAAFEVAKKSPEILIFSGIAVVIGGTIVACKQTLKVDNILDKAKEDLEKIHKVEEDPKFEKEYSKEDAKKDKAIVYVKTFGKLAKTYLPAIAIIGTGVAMILCGHKILKTRYLGLSAAYAALDESFKAYRGRVKDRFGDEVENQIRYNVQTEEVKETVTDEEGKKKTVKKNVVIGAEDASEYAKWYDSNSAWYERDPLRAQSFLKLQQAYWNEKLRADGYVFLNDVYKSLGLTPTKAGQIMGWRFAPDKYIDFGIFNPVNDWDKFIDQHYFSGILLDFNVDGEIWNVLC